MQQEANYLTLPPDVIASIAAKRETAMSENPALRVLFEPGKPSIDSRDLHRMLGGVREHSTWLSGVMKSARLVEGKHYTKYRDEDPTSVKANGGKVPTRFALTQAAAVKIVAFSKSPLAAVVFDYMDTVAALTTPYLLRAAQGDAE